MIVISFATEAKTLAFLLSVYLCSIEVKKNIKKLLFSKSANFSHQRVKTVPKKYTFKVSSIFFPTVPNCV